MKKRVIIFIVLICMLSLNSCGSQSKTEVVANPQEIKLSETEPSTIPTVSESESSQLSTSKIASKVVNNCRECAIRGDRIYYINAYDNETLYSMNTNGKDNRKLTNDRTSWFYVSDDRIYYQNRNSGYNIYAMNIDGSKTQKLNDDSSGDIHIIGNKIYYSNNDDGFKLYCMNTDGSDRKKLSDDIPLYMNVVDDRIYYSGDLNGMKGIYSIKTDGTDRVKLTDDSPGLMLVANGWIYYSNNNDDYKLYAIKINGSDRYKLSNDYALTINLVDNLIYYENGNNEKIYCISTDGNNKKLLSNDHAAWLVVDDGRIYYTISGANIYSMNIDGSDKQLIADLDSDVYKNVTYEINARLRKDMPKFRFVATGVTMSTNEWETGYVMGLEIFDEKGLSLLSANFSQASYDEVMGYPVYNEMMDTMGLHVVDVNFDGYNDVIILNSFCGAHSNTWYTCCLWDPEASSFVESKSFSEICNPSLDPKKKCIYSTGGSGASNQGWEIYKFIDNDFLITNSLSYEGINEGCHIKEEKLVNKKMEIVRDDVIQEVNLDKVLSQEGYINDGLWQLDHPRWYMTGGHQADQWLE